MTSTRNKNTSSNYCLEQRNNTLMYDYTEYNHSQYGAPYSVAIPCLGIMPSYMSRDTLSYNSIDIESYLKGTGSTNLVNPQSPIKPLYKNINVISYFDRLELLMPEPLIVENNNRPFPIP
jgi:hypothetical protein